MDDPKQGGCLHYRSEQLLEKDLAIKSVFTIDLEEGQSDCREP